MGLTTQSTYSKVQISIYSNLMKKVWSLLLAYSFLFVYVINAQHGFEHIKNHETKHHCAQCLHFSKVVLKEQVPEFALDLPKIHSVLTCNSDYQNPLLQNIYKGNVSKRGPPSLTV